MSPGASWQLDALRVAGLVLALALGTAGMVALWAARHRADGERVVLPIVGRVGVPTCLTIGLCALGAAYHAAAYSLSPRVAIWAVPLDRWWIVAAVIVLALASSFASEWLESRHGDGDVGS